MKTQIILNQLNIPDNINQKLRVMIHENELKMQAWIKKNQRQDYYTIYAESPYFNEEVHVVINKKELVIQAGIKVEVRKPYWIKKQNNESFFVLNTVYAIIKSCKIFLPDDANYNLVSYEILHEGLLLVTIRRWNNDFNNGGKSHEKLI